MTYDIHSDEYFKPDALEKELLRVYDLCHGCRVCFSLCPSFPTLFDFIDAHVDAGEGETDALTEDEVWEVVDLCYNCKLCYPKCPYTPPHDFMIDFPRLMLRAKAVDAKQHGIPLQDRFFGRPDIIGKIGSWTAPVANAINATRLGRVALEKTVGLHRDFNLPTFDSEPFPKWFEKNAPKHAPRGEPVAKVALFSTCTVDYNAVPSGQAVAQVLWHNNIEVVLPEQVCCGMPLLDAGDVDGCTRAGRKNVDVFLEQIDKGYDVVIPGPTCSFVFKDDYPELVGTEESKRVAKRTYDFCEYLMRLHGEGKLNTKFERGAGRVGYHLPCHLKVQNIGMKSRDVLNLIPDTEVTAVEKCSAVDGTWGMKAQYFDLSQKYASKLYKGLEAVDADLYVSDCPMARQNIIYGTGRPAYHPAEVLRDAYGLPRPRSRPRRG